MTDPCPMAMRGIVPSLNTPFAADGSVDDAAVARLVDASVRAGIAGMLLIAVAGEQASLSREEKARIARVAVETTAGRVPVIVSITNPDAEERVALARLARAAGADGICCQVPAGLSGRAIDDAMAEVAAAGPDLLMIQDLDWGGGGLSIADIARLFATLPSFRCLKVETVPAGPKYTRVLEATDGKLHVSGGWAVMQMPDALARGVHAFMPTAMDAIYVAIHAAHARGATDEARALFERLLPIIAFSNQHVDVSIRFFKRLRAAEGIFTTDHCRAPVAPLDAIQAREADTMIRRALDLQRAVLADVT